MPSRSLWIALTVVLIFATVLRIHRLGRESLWHDEAHSALLARTSVLAIARESAAMDNNPPLYYALLRGWTLLAGEREAGLRSLSVAAGIGGIAAAFGLARALGGGVVALWTSLLLSVSLFHVLYSREARMYSLLFLLATLSMYAFVKLPRGRRAIDALYVVSSVGTFYAHTVGIFVLVAHQFCWAAMRRFLVGDRAIPLGRWTRLQLCVAVCIAPWVYVSSRQLHRLQGVFWIPRPTLGSIVDSLIEMAGSPRLFWLAAGLAVVGVMALLVATARTWSLRSPDELPPVDSLVLLAIWSIAPIALPWLVSFIAVPIFMPRIAIASLGPLTILVAFGITAIRPRLAGIVVGLVLVTASTFEVVRWEGRTTKENWRDLTRYVEGAAQPGDLLVFHQSARRLGFRYYSRRADFAIVGYPERRFPAGEFVQPRDLAALDAITHDHARVWLILSDSKDPEHLIPTHLAKSYKSRGQREFFGLSAELFERRSDAQLD